MDVKTVLTLEKSAKGLRVATTICNQAKDHRVRVIFPTGLHTSMHMADSAFEVVRRNNRHNDTWTNPCGCERQQCFAAMEDEKGGLLVANRGLYEYEILEEQENAIAVTLLRCVAEMGDWDISRHRRHSSLEHSVWSLRLCHMRPGRPALHLRKAMRSSRI